MNKNYIFTIPYSIPTPHTKKCQEVVDLWLETKSKKRKRFHWINVNDEHKEVNKSKSQFPTFIHYLNIYRIKISSRIYKSYIFCLLYIFQHSLYLVCGNIWIVRNIFILKWLIVFWFINLIFSVFVYWEGVWLWS